MSDPQRYTLALPDISYGMDESSKGEYVLWRDYAKLKAEVERLEQQVQYWKIEAECDHGRWLRCLEELETLRKKQ